MRAPIVSVLMSVYNGEQFLCDAIESILFQSLRDLELIVVNDGSTDATAEILRGYQQKDSRLRVFHQDNLGLIESLNRGAGFSRGKYIARMDADDIAPKNRLALQVNFLEKQKELAVVGGSIDVINASGIKLETCHFPTSDEEIKSTLVSGTCPICHPATVMRAQAFRSVGGYRKAFAEAEDYDLWLRLADGFRLANLEAVVLRYRRHQGQVSVRKFKQQQLSNLAARTSALARMCGRPDPFDQIEDVTPTVLTSLGVSQERQHAAVVRGYLTCIRSMSDASETAVVREKIEAMLGSLEWKNADRSLAVDFRLLSARIHWREQRYLRSISAAGRAIITRPKILCRPIKPLMRRLRPLRPVIMAIRDPTTSGNA